MKAHRTDIVSFGFGLFFLAIAAWWLLAQLLGLALPPAGWFLAGALILIGVLGLVGTLRSGRPPTPGDGTGPGDGVGSGDVPTRAGGSFTGPEGLPRAGEQPTGAVTDRPVEAVEDRPVSDAGTPHWSPSEPVTGPPAAEGHRRA